METLTGVEIRHVVNPHEIEAIERHIFKTYVTEMGWVPDAPNPSGLRVTADFRLIDDVPCEWIGMFAGGQVVGHVRVVDGLEMALYQSNDEDGAAYTAFAAYLNKHEEVRVCETNRLAVAKYLRGSLAFTYLAFSGVYYATALQYNVAFATTTTKLAAYFAERFGVQRIPYTVKYSKNDMGRDVIKFPLGTKSQVSRMLYALKWQVSSFFVNLFGV